MQIISKEDVQKAREMDLLTYLTYYEPGNLKHVSGTVYSTVEHDSLIINNGKWCWFSQGIGGRSALDYLIKVKGIPFRDAVQRIIGNIQEPLPKAIVTPLVSQKEFIMPEVSNAPKRAAQYLVNRGIDSEIVNWCIEHKQFNFPGAFIPAISFDSSFSFLSHSHHQFLLATDPRLIR